MYKLPHAARTNESSFRLTSHALVAAMVTCAAFTLLSLIQRLLPGWQPFYLPVLCFFGALERLYTFKRFEKLALFSREWTISLTSEWVVILLLVKLATGLSHGLGAFAAEIPTWLVNFNRNFFTDDFGFASVLVIITWFVSGKFAGLLYEMDISQAMLLELDSGQENGQKPARERLLTLIFSIGTLLIILTALVRLDIRAFLAHTNVLTFTNMPSLTGGGASTLLYFMFGMALLSQTRFIDLHTRWSVQHIPVNRRLGRDWALYSLAFLGLMAALVALFPTNYSLQTINILSRGLNLVTNLLFLFVQAVLAFLIFLISLPILFLGGNPYTIKRPAPLPQIPQVNALGQAIPPPAWWDATKTLIFWAVLLAILLFSLIQYGRQHKEVLYALQRLATHTRLSRLWNWLRSHFRKVRTGIAHTLKAGRERLRGAPASDPTEGGVGLSPHKLDARKKITFFYLALIRRAGENGLPRRSAQTPYEYASTLDAALPDMEEDIDRLTDAFIEARYSPRPVEPEHVNLAKSTWERLRKALKNKSAV